MECKHTRSQLTIDKSSVGGNKPEGSTLNQNINNYKAKTCTTMGKQSRALSNEATSNLYKQLIINHQMHNRLDRLLYNKRDLERLIEMEICNVSGKNRLSTMKVLKEDFKCFN